MLQASCPQNWSIDRHWLSQALHIPSPNFNERPEPISISLLVIHGISLPPGEFGGPYIAQLFTNCLPPEQHPYFAAIRAARVSAHLLIRRDGQLTQFVAFDKRAWHAGESCFEGQSNCNDFAIGIELEGCDDRPYEAIQYEVLAQISALLMLHYPAITPERILGHSDIAPGRKTDPGPAFDWARYRGLLRSQARCG